MRISRNLGLASIVGASALIGCNENFSNSKNPDKSCEHLGKVTIYCALQDDNLIPNESFELAEQFLEENTGYDFNFERVNYGEIDNFPLNHKDSFALVEASEKFMIGRFKKKVEGSVSIDSEISLLEGLIDNFNKNGDLDGLERCNRLIKDLKEMDRQIKTFAENFYSISAGEADLEASRVYMIASPAVKLFRDIYSLSEGDLALQKSFYESYESFLEVPINPEGRKEVEDTLAKLKSNIRKSEIDLASHYDDLVKSSSNNIVHEVGHIFGLYHTHQFDNDGLEDITEEGLPNVMSYKSPGKGKYGFAFTAEQIVQIRDYLSEGRTFRELQEVGFDFPTYLDCKAQENGWIKTENK